VNSFSIPTSPERNPGDKSKLNPSGAFPKGNNPKSGPILKPLKTPREIYVKLPPIDMFFDNPL
jgi:hypothetical protein